MHRIQTMKILFGIFLVVALINVVNYALKNLENLFEEKKEKEKSIKYLVYSCDHCGGWADRLKGILSSYVMAEILNRKFIIEFKQPCPLENIIDPNHVKWNERIVEKYNEDNSFKIDFGYRIDLIKWLEKIDVLNLTDKKYLRLTGGIMFSDAFVKNEHVTARLRELDYEPSKLYLPNHLHRWYTELFKLPSQMKSNYDEFKKKVKGAKLICAQVRVGSSTGGKSQDEHFMPRQNARLYWEFMRREFLEKQNMNRSEYKVFVTSDQEDVKVEAAKYFGADRVLYNADSSYHFDRDFRQENDLRCKTLQKVLYDFQLMGLCDAIVVSHSGFGLFGAFNRKDPYKNLFVYTFKDQKDLEKDLSKIIWNRKNKELEFRRVKNLQTDLYFI